MSEFILLPWEHNAMNKRFIRQVLVGKSGNPKNKYYVGIVIDKFEILRKYYDTEEEAEKVFADLWEQLNG